MSVFYDAGLVFESNLGSGTAYRQGDTRSLLSRPLKCLDKVESLFRICYQRGGQQKSSWILYMYIKYDIWRKSYVTF